MTIRRLDEKQVKYIIRERKKNTKSSVIAKRMNVTTRRVNQIYAHYVKTGSAPIARRIGRPKIEPTQKEIKIVTETYKQKPLGVVRLTKYLHTLGIQISYSTVQKIMIAKGLVSPSLAKRKRRKWIRYERKYSNAMWHVDWHIIKDSRWRNLYLICYLDDASRCITGFGVYQNATADNTVRVLNKAIKMFGAPKQILSDHGTQFTSTRKSEKGDTKLTLFEEELDKRGITHLLARVNHPQINGKLERFFGTFESEIDHFDDIDEFIDYYNESRLHFAPDIDNGETPLMAFKAKKANAKIRENPNWAEEDSDVRK